MYSFVVVVMVAVAALCQRPYLILTSNSVQKQKKNSLQDVIVHVRDISNPNHEDQKKNVEETLARMKLSRDLRDNIIEVGNKVDRLPR